MRSGAGGGGHRDGADAACGAAVAPVPMGTAFKSMRSSMDGGTGDVFCGGITDPGGSGDVGIDGTTGGNKIACDEVAGGRLTKKGGCA